MSAEPGGRVLIASNRGPVSFRLGDDGKLTSHRGGGGLVSGLSAIAGRAEMLWVCAALSDADRAAARAAPGGYLDVSLGADGEPRGRLPRSRCSTSPRPSTTAPTTRSPTPRSGSSTTCSTTPPTGPCSGLRSAGSGSRSVPTTRRSPTRWPTGRARTERTGRGRWCRTITSAWCRVCSPSSALTWRSRTSRTPRGRRRSTTRCCPTTWQLKCSTASWAPITLASTRGAGPTRSSIAARTCSVRGWTGSRAPSGTPATPPRSACTRWAWTRRSFGPGRQRTTCKPTSTCLPRRPGTGS